MFKFFDKDFNELTCFTERPAAVYQMEGSLGDYFAAAYPETRDATAPLDQMSEETHSLYVTFVRQFRAENNKRWQQLFVDEIKARLNSTEQA